MSERYSRLFALPDELYAKGAPAVIAAGALLKDNQTGRVLAQLKLRSIADKKIKAATVVIRPVDTAGEALGGEVTHQYLDLSARRDGEFGQKEPVVMPDASTRGFSAELTEVIFEDNTKWQGTTEPWSPLKPSDTVEQICRGDAELMKQFRMKYGERSRVAFARDRDLWRCTCGALNHEDEEVCHVCSVAAAKLAEPVDLASLKTASDERVTTAKRKKRKKIGIIFGGIAAAIVLVIVGMSLYFDVLLPSMAWGKLERAIEQLEAGENEAAYETIISMDDFSDIDEDRLPELEEFEILSGDEIRAVLSGEEWKLFDETRDSDTDTYRIETIDAMFNVDGTVRLIEEDGYEIDDDWDVYGGELDFYVYEYNVCHLAGDLYATVYLHDDGDIGFINMFMVKLTDNVPDEQFLSGGGETGGEETEVVWDIDLMNDGWLMNTINDTVAQGDMKSAYELFAALEDRNPEAAADMGYSIAALPTSEVWVTDGDEDDPGTHTYVYDDMGRLIEEDYAPYDGYAEHTAYEYDGELLVYEETEVSGDSYYTITCEYAYDENGNLTSEVYTGGNGNTETHGYLYGDDGLMISQTLENADGQHSWGYTYDEEGRLLTETYTHPNPNLGWTKTYTYNDDGTLASIAEDSEMYQRMYTYEYGSDGNLTYEAGTTNGELSYDVTYSYDSDGNETGHVRRTYADGDINLEFDYEYEYNEYGDVAKETSVRTIAGTEPETDVTEYTYEYAYFLLD